MILKVGYAMHSDLQLPGEEATGPLLVAPGRRLGRRGGRRPSFRDPLLAQSLSGWSRPGSGRSGEAPRARSQPSGGSAPPMGGSRPPSSVRRDQTGGGRRMGAGREDFR